VTAALLSYAPLLLLTLAIECRVIAAIAPRGERRNYLAVCLALNLLTHPLATLLSWRWGADILLIEGLVLLVEWLGYARLLGLSTVRSLWCSFATNLCSAAIAFVLWSVFLF